MSFMSKSPGSLHSVLVGAGAVLGLVNRPEERPSTNYTNVIMWRKVPAQNSESPSFKSEPM
jgi:hypothetical protein